MSLQPRPALSFEDWFDSERAAGEGRTEFVDGEVFAMTGASLAHNAIVSNINRELSIRLKGRPGQVYANDVKVLIRSANAGKYPDLVICWSRRIGCQIRDPGCAAYPLFQPGNQAVRFCRSKTRAKSLA